MIRDSGRSWWIAALIAFGALLLVPSMIGAAAAGVLASVDPWGSASSPSSPTPPSVASPAMSTATPVPIDASGGLSWPEHGAITQRFGCTSYAFEPWDATCPTHHVHTGLDIAAPFGTPVRAAESGTAETFASATGYGNYIILHHANGLTTLYGHLSAFAVISGATVIRGQLIGFEGSTGNSTGPHLHFEVRVHDRPQDPLMYLAPA